MYSNIFRFAKKIHQKMHQIDLIRHSPQLIEPPKP